ncbi:MAG: FAD-linked oxidase C-terminal domain-containing protein [Syntrophotalea acetylenica]|jgi:glycolate oxidase|uniref:Glycolate oxidase subunit GlcD n=1 Tax=Syntrophotalea acetylenica TaxID=29542 RepID=A0A1L3GJZ9_SYNAC|nr:FAD-linked oxidase C-terminal domain-containing protein [Syntrophotalea acetylenica]APG26273.1 glycolate oxidase subunit GlcD [Syntrophotalea acetylenica]APG45268.1 glycolate oxidase subunit GlcD [Syntrophotalea acetylenica]MDD4456889.1 FAD-linked oxidase C-terminal domain-containing protein [Syntrophotalea acetylenica]MDY0261008.1 FAD-linked oxidase C-terminal domain-containing protein [Syntrophotalea acetylenica]
MLDNRIITILRDIVGKQYVSTEQADRICYSYDATQQQFFPDVIVRPADAAQVSLILKMANAENLPVYPRGAGSGFTGGSVPIRGGIALVLTRLNRILRIDQDNLIAEVEPGVVTATLQKAVEEVGLFYPPDPASLKFSTLGGNVAECAGGPRCVKYGVTKDYVLGLEVVTPTGDIIRTGGETMKGVVGYDLTKLMVGSEGTLGVITRIILKLLPRPEAKKTMLVMFDSIDGAAQAVSNIIRGKIIPTTLEFMDATALACVRQNANLDIPESARAVLIIEVDGDRELLERQATRILEIASPLGVVHTSIAATDEESERLWQVRRSVSPSLRKVNPDKYNEDICVPRSKLPDMIRAIESISNRLEIPIVNFGHAGDGNIHVNIMVDRSLQGQEEKAETAIREIFAKTLELGGTMSGEHGVGTSKAPYLGMELDPATMACMKTIKHALDPKQILNPGKIFPVDGPTA